MGLGTSVGLIAAGAVLVWALDLDIPYVREDLLGQILLVAGLVAAAVLAAIRAQRPDTSPTTGVVMVTLGSVLIWALEVDIPHVYDEALGFILLVGGLVTTAAAVVMSRPRTQRRQVVYRS